MNIKSKLCFLLCMVSINSYQGAASNYLKFEKIVGNITTIGMSSLMQIVKGFNKIAYGNLQASGDDLTLFNGLMLNVKDDKGSAFLSLSAYVSKHKKIPECYQIADAHKEEFIQILVKSFPFYTEGQRPEYVAKMPTTYENLLRLSDFVTKSTFHTDKQGKKIQEDRLIYQDILSTPFALQLLYDMLSNINESQKKNHVDGANGEDQQKNDKFLQAIQVKIDEYPDNFINDQMNQLNGVKSDAWHESIKKDLYTNTEEYRQLLLKNKESMEIIRGLLANRLDAKVVEWLNLRENNNFQRMIEDVSWQNNSWDINTLTNWLMYSYVPQVNQLNELKAILKGIPQAPEPSLFSDEVHKLSDYLNLKNFLILVSKEVDNDLLFRDRKDVDERCKYINQLKQNLSDLLLNNGSIGKDEWIRQSIEEIKLYSIQRDGNYYINYIINQVLCKDLVDHIKTNATMESIDINIQTTISHLQKKIISTDAEKIELIKKTTDKALSDEQKNIINCIIESKTKQIQKDSDYIQLLEAIVQDTTIKNTTMNFNVMDFLPPLKKPSKPSKPLPKNSNSQQKKPMDQPGAGEGERDKQEDKKQKEPKYNGKENSKNDPSLDNQTRLFSKKTIGYFVIPVSVSFGGLIYAQVRSKKKLKLIVPSELKQSQPQEFSKTIG